MGEKLVKIRFTQDCDGWEPGHEGEFPAGVADAYVNWRGSAVFVESPKQELAEVAETPEPPDIAGKGLAGPPENKAILGPGKGRRTK